MLRGNYLKNLVKMILSSVSQQPTGLSALKHFGQ